jgi:hypothetical protein
MIIAVPDRRGHAGMAGVLFAASSGWRDTHARNATDYES